MSALAAIETQINIIRDLERPSTREWMRRTMANTVVHDPGKGLLGPQDADLLANLIHNFLELSVPFHVSAPVSDLIVTASRSLPDLKGVVIQMEELPEPYGFVKLGADMPLASGKASLVAVQWAAAIIGNGRIYATRRPGESNALMLIGWFDDGLLPVPALGSFVQLVRFDQNSVYRLDYEFTPTSYERDVYCYVATLLAFMRQRVLTTSHEIVMNRGASRRVRRAGRAPEAKVIRLRRVRANPQGGKREVEWTCRWLVRGHWRSQWYPRTASHRPVWIMPYVKGPDDAPLVAKASQYDVSR
jgi:hypothetical protein